MSNQQDENVILLFGLIELLEKPDKPVIHSLRGVIQTPRSSVSEIGEAVINGIGEDYLILDHLEQVVWMKNSDYLLVREFIQNN